VEEIKIRRSRRIRISNKIRIQPLCGEHPFGVLYLFPRRSKGFHYKNR
jgi:hypothetical protein